jgi:hypothetical protein
MPRINRIRVINFSYNNDSRHILDETFNFHGGENALLNLANGGGKSVLVQLFLQPVIPNAKIQGRNLAGFFHKKRLPAYIMIEWKLDDAGGYLVTGVAIVSVEAGTEDEKSRIRYFTFTSKYTGANPFDIANIAVVSRRGSVLDVLPFREARDMMGDRERKDQFNFGYYHEDEGDRYRKYLAGFGIVQDEWRNIIARINDSEGGIEEIFQKYKNSGQLLNEWIIKTVERAMSSNLSEASRLEEMLSGLVREVIENERFIVEKQLLAGFLDRFGEQLGLLDGLLKGLEEQGRLAGRLSALHAYLASGARALLERYEENEQGIVACRAEEQRLQLEERSEDYLRKGAAHEQTVQRLAAIEAAGRETETALQQAERQSKILRAARIAGEIAQKKAELAGIEEQLAAAREQGDTDGRLRSLEYSLRVLYESRLGDLAKVRSRLGADRTDREGQAQAAGKELQEVDRERSLLDAERGGLEERWSNFQKEEREILRRLGLDLRRNLLGELDAAEAAKTRVALERARDGLAGERSGLKAEREAGAQRCRVIDGEERDLRAASIEEKAALTGLDREIAQYEQEERAIEAILNRYGLAPELRFDQERLAADFGKLLKDLGARRDETVSARDEAAEALRSLRNGMLHIPPEWAELLARLDIEYDTGESYLRNQPPEIRQRLLEGNPVLPYTFIMSGADIDRVASAAGGMTARRVIPLIAYEDLGMTLESEGRLARTGEGVAFVCLYEGRVFDSDSLAELVAEFERRRGATLEQHDHYADAYQTAVSDRAACSRFSYGAGHHRKLEQQRDQCARRRQDLQDRIAGLAEERDRLAGRDGELGQKLEQLQAALRQAEERAAAFAGLVAREEQYQACCTRLTTVLDQVAALKTRKLMLERKLSGLQKEAQGLAQEIWRRDQEWQEAEQQYRIYREAPAAERVDGSIEDLEQRLKALKEQYSGDIRQLEERKRQRETEYAVKQKELRKLGLEEREYAGAVCDEQAEERISEELAGLVRQQQENQVELKQAIREEASAGTYKKNALEEVRRLGVEAPLSPAEITGDFEGRRRLARRRLKELDEDNNRIVRQKDEYSRLRERIEQAIGPGTIEPESGFTPEPDVGAQTNSLEQFFRRLKDDNRNAAAGLRERYLGLKAEYRDRQNHNIDNIFKGLDPLWERTGLEFDGFFYLYERMKIHAEKLGELITLYENQLANLERNKKDMVQQSFLHGRRICEEIQRISDNSKVRIQGRTRAVQMLKIEMQHDTDEASLQRMAQHIEESVSAVREETRLAKREDEIAKTIARRMSGREMLNVYLGNAHIPISVFKIDLNMQNSHLKLWEDAVRENSGGEKFVVFFSVLSALMAYTRARAMEEAGADAEADTRVLLMDNPFGPISSEHLLGPLFEIARKHRTQLICLSDLKQNSIMNCFNLIYMLKVRSAAIGGNEYLKFEEVIRDESAIKDDERLEKAVFRTSEVKQLALFDEG